MVADGFGSAQHRAYRYFKEDGAPPVWEDGFRALVRTGSASSPTTDSAAAATAFATGVKTRNGAVAVDADGDPLVSVLDLASEDGKATGIVSTAAITDATPAAFAASTADRTDHAGIAQQYVDDGRLDLILGGGRARFTVDADGDGATTLEEAQAAGFAYVSTREEMLDAAGDRLVGLFSDGDLGPPIGNGAAGARPAGEPSLAEMTEAALDRLSKDPDGFFLVVEEEGTDRWGHANDGATVMNAAKAYEDAVRVAKAFAEANPGTLVISVADHETGGLTLPLASGRTPAIFRSFTATYADVLAAIEEALAGAADPVASVRQIVLGATGGAVSLTDVEIGSVVEARTSADAYAALAMILNARGGLDYATRGHTAADVALSAYGAGADLHGGVLENTAVAHWLAEAMGLSMPPGQPAGGDVLMDLGDDGRVRIEGTDLASLQQSGFLLD
jgi:alkaline phosphatase